MNSMRILAFAALSFFFLSGCGQDSGRRTTPAQPFSARGRLVESLAVTGAYAQIANVEQLNFGGAILTKLNVPLNVTVTEAADEDVLEELFWESAKEAHLLSPAPNHCVPSLFGIHKSEGRYELRFWGWDNVGISTDCEKLIFAMRDQGLRLQLKNVKWAEVGLVRNFDVTLRPPPQP